jgi:hypothetical protein
MKKIVALTQAISPETEAKDLQPWNIPTIAHLPTTGLLTVINTVEEEDRLNYLIFLFIRLPFKQASPLYKSLPANLKENYTKRITQPHPPSFIYPKATQLAVLPKNTRANYLREIKTKTDRSLLLSLVQTIREIQLLRE